MALIKKKKIKGFLKRKKNKGRLRAQKKTPFQKKRARCKNTKKGKILMGTLKILPLKKEKGKKGPKK